MRRTLRILALTVCIALLSTPLTWAAPSAQPATADFAPGALVHGLLGWLQEAVSGLLSQAPLAPGGLAAAPAATETGSQDAAGDGPTGGPTAQAGVTIDPDG